MFISNQYMYIKYSFRFCKIQDVVDVTLYLLSDQSRMITGVCLPVDGGFLAI